MSLKILVTGGYGLVGKSLQKVVKSCNYDGTFYFLSRKDCDLRNSEQTINWFTQYNPDIVIHLASRVGGVYDNMNGNYDYLVDNARININVVEACKVVGVKLIINILSTCIFPDKNVSYPLTSDQLHNGLPHHSNIGYAYSKRILHLASHLLTQNVVGTNVINLTPTNLYGDYDNYNLKSSHVIPGLIHKTSIAKMTSSELRVYGTGKAMRQFLYVDDLSRVILQFIDLYKNGLNEKEISCIVSPPESSEISIKSLIEEICRIFNFTGEICYDTSYPDGQYKKTASSDELSKYLPNFSFTPISNGLENTIKFFNENMDKLRL